MSSAKPNLRFIQGRMKEEFARLQGIFDLTKKLTNENAKLFITKSQSVPRIREAYRSLLDSEQLALMDGDEKYEPDFSKMSTFDDMVDVIETCSKSIQLRIDEASRPQTSAMDVKLEKMSPKIKLPRQILPTFDGKFENWPNFYQTFDKLINKNNDLDDLEKVNYLVTHLEGSAKSICAGIPATAENYNNLYANLVNRYQDLRTLGSYYLDKLFNFKPLVKESEEDLNNFLNNFLEPAHALKELNIEQFFDFLVVYLAVKKLDPVTCREFEHSLRDKNLPSFQDLDNFIRTEVKIVARQEIPGRNKAGFVRGKTRAFVTQQNSQLNSAKAINLESSRSCVACKSQGSHALYRCKTFQNLSSYGRFVLVRRKQLCFNCFQQHSVKVCPSDKTCQHCGKRHHTMLHFEGKGSSSSPAPVDTTDTNSNVPPAVDNSLPRATALVSNNTLSTTVLLATAQVAVFDSKGVRHIIRALLDCGSQSNFISKNCVDRLNLDLSPTDLIVDTIGKNSTSCNGRVSFTFSSVIKPNITYDINAFVLDSITDDLPTLPLSLGDLHHLEDLQLADQHYNVPGPVDLLISAALWPKIIKSRRKNGPVGTPSAFDSTLGWIVMGDVHLRQRSERVVNYLSITNSGLDSLLQRFWDIEEIPGSSNLNKSDEICEQFFLDTVKRESDGRFVVALPFCKSPDLLGNSFEGSLRRYLALERRLHRDPLLMTQYSEVMTNHISAGYISLISNVGKYKHFSPAYYVPHHAVLKPGSVSTPLRIVWDMSSSSSSGYSLNDLVHVGPKLQLDLFNLLLRFRCYKIALSADVRQMFLRILVRQEDRKFQRFLWRSDPSEDISIWEMNTVVFGLASSPYLAQRVLHHLAELEGSKYPLAANVVKNNVYMDDIVVSVPTEREAADLYSQLDDLFKLGSFSLAKWCSSSPTLLEGIPSELRLDNTVTFDDKLNTKILGLCWDPQLDLFKYALSLPEEFLCTKRRILSVIARIFDPLGMLAPVIVVAKILMKELWQLKSGWDDALPSCIQGKWRTFATQLARLEQLSIPRHVGISPGFVPILIGFSDASKDAYGAVIYVHVRSADGSPLTTNLLCAKSKVAPKSATTIPRLELLGALLLAKLIKSVVETYKDSVVFKSIYACTDATVVLQWINSPASRWKVFVANRVQQIQDLIGVNPWHHVRGVENPADCLSRGLTVQSLINHPIWFHGPTWLVNCASNWPIIPISDLNNEGISLEEVKLVVLKTTIHQEWILAPLLDRVSTFKKLMRVTAWVLRFIKKGRVKGQTLTPSEIAYAERLWLNHVQNKHFADAFTALQENSAAHQVKLPPKYIKLDLFIDDGLLRVGGRLQNSSLPYEQRHPVLLPKEDPFVRLLVDQWHVDNLHTGPYLLHSLLRTQFWIISGRDLIRQRVHKCNVCFKVNPKATHHKMAPLPSVRLQEVKAFSNCGVDYAGPFQISLSRRRGLKTQKAYLCLFVCLSTKAIHLELVSDLSTPSFLAAFHRFLSRRGPCSVIYSDQGTNFVGARSVLRELYDFISSQNHQGTLQDELTHRGIEWRMNPPSAPHFGGVWESQIKSVKTHLKRVVGSQILTYEEMTTVLCQIEALLNSRPLCPLGEDSSAPDALTPSHFLTLGAQLSHFPSKDVLSVPANRLSHHERVNQIVQHYWLRWSREYLHTLQQRSKWCVAAEPLSPGDLVLILKETTPPLEWPLAKVEELLPGPDGIARVARLKTKIGNLIRPVVKLCKLPTQ